VPVDINVLGLKSLVHAQVTRVSKVDRLFSLHQRVHLCLVVDHGQNLKAQDLGFGQMAKPENRTLAGQVVVARVKTHKPSKHGCVVQGLPYRRAREAEPLLQKVVAQRPFNGKRRAITFAAGAGACGAINDTGFAQGNTSTRLISSTNSRLDLRSNSLLLWLSCLIPSMSYIGPGRRGSVNLP
jgi:hypothetical protein